MIDVRFLPNPYYDPELRPLTGLDAPVRDFVMYRKETEDFMICWKALLDCVMPGYVSEGKQQLASTAASRSPRRPRTTCAPTAIA